MPPSPRPVDREELAEKRIRNVLREHVIVTARTLEQKISDAGPGPMRIDPHVLGGARKKLIDEGVVRKLKLKDTPWFHLTAASKTSVEKKLALVQPVHDRMMQKDVLMRVGQTLEIAVFKALVSSDHFETLGSYTDLDDHDDSSLYVKEEPPSSIGRRRSPGKLDFIVIGANREMAGLEVKNIREWIYPNRKEIMYMLDKCTALNIIPVLIARRIPYVTFKLLNACGAIVHQTYNQFFPETEAELAAKVRDKNLLGYHDVRTGNEPDERLNKFIKVNLPKLIESRRPVFDEYKDLLRYFGTGQMPYAEFAARVRRRLNGLPEDNDWPLDEEDTGYY